MSFRVETTPNNYTDYDLFSATRFNQLGKQFLSLINPNYGTTPASAPAAAAPPPPADKKEDAPTTETEPPKEESKPISPNQLQKPSDLCRPSQNQPAYYLANQDMLKKLEENFLPHQSILPYTSPSTNTNHHDEQLTASITDWQGMKQAANPDRYVLSQIITIVQCRSTFSSSPFASPPPLQRVTRHAVRLFINVHQQQQQQMNTFLDIVNEALFLEAGTIKTLWDANGEQVSTKKEHL
jgi:hypothetical protein